MRNITILLFMFLICCKSETKTEDGIDQTVYEMWDNYTNANPQSAKEELPDSWFFHNNRADANRLGELVLSGKKQAGSGLYAWYEEANADLPAIGTKNIITNFNGKALVIIETTKVDTIPFNQISEAYAKLDMGTKIEPLEKWKKAHWDFFKSVQEESGVQPTKDMLIVCESFEAIWPKKH